MKRDIFALTLFMLTLFVACHPFDLPQEEQINPGIEKNMSELDLPADFKFSTTQNATFRIAALDNKSHLLAHVPFRVLAKNAETGTSELLFSGKTDGNGNFETVQNLPLAALYLTIETDFPGLPPSEFKYSGEKEIQLTLGSNNQVKDRSEFAIQKTNTSFSGVSDRSTFTYLGNYNANGVPAYLEPQGDAVSQDILNMIAVSLPESQPVPSYHPEYITNNVQTNTVLTDSASIWVTFVHEGAGYRNALGYYIYPTGQTPQSAAQIGTLKVIFPNVSFTGSGGNLHTGDKVYLGDFPAGTTIGWFLVPDGWQSGSQTVSDANHPIRYSDKQANTFTSANYRNHVVQLVDPNRELLLLGIEDLDRPGGDNDFNDAIFYITANPFTAVNRTDMAETTIGGTDADNDGVPDNFDAAPTDPSYAYISYTPSQNQNGTLAFEDLFPKKGDFDMNDLVVDYRFEEHLTAANKITSITADFTIRAIGGSFRNGLGIELPVSPNLVASVTGERITDNYLTMLPNGTEANQSTTVIFPFDNAYNSMLPPGTITFANTVKAQTQFSPVTAQVVITFNTPINRSELGTAPFNPFLVVNRERGKEVHLPGKSPTGLANIAYFNTEDDNTNLNSGKTYQTQKGLPWALNLPVSFQYPIEKTPINQVYLKFNKWAESGGNQWPDWYKNLPGYRAPENIY